MKKIKIGLIGCGTIGSSLARFVNRHLRARAALAYLCDLHPEKAVSLKKKLRSPARIVPAGLLIRNSDLILEAASAEISGEVALKALQLHKQILIMSVGGLIDPAYLSRILKIRRGNLFIPSGALAGIDALAASREGKIRRVRLITRKPPESLKGAPYFESRAFPKFKGNEERRIFKGAALEAVKAFPQNINVAALLSLAGLGPRRTEVEIWTSPRYRFNQHEVRVEGDSGSIRAVTSNVPSPENPKTSRLAILSAQAALRKIFSSIKIGT